MHQFILENVGHMHVDTMTAEVHKELQRRVSMFCCDENENIDVDLTMVREHITTHTLNPTIRIGIMLRGLLDLGEKMKGDLYKLDANGHNLGLDPKMIDVYLRLQTQIVSVYRSEPARMLFNNSSSGNANNSTHQP
jgi:hypothetical protein